jgi:hypothetical protein
MEKTVKEWFETIEDPEIRANAIANTSRDRLELLSPSLVSSLYNAFTWGLSLEKHKYWEDFTATLNNK